jgi:transcriptional regulator with XRE-family HTH domain
MANVVVYLMRRQPQSLDEYLLSNAAQMAKKTKAPFGRAWAMPVLESPSSLAQMRLKHGMSIQQISDRTKISIRYLQAIEAGEFRELPAGIYGRSYIRQYADAIHCNAEHLLTMCPLELRKDSVEDGEPRDGMMRAKGGRLIGRLVHLAARWRGQSSQQKGGMPL